MAYQGFDKLESQLANQPGVTSPGGLAATIGRNTYSTKRFNTAAAQGKSLKGARKVKKHHVQALRGR